MALVIQLALHRQHTRTRHWALTELLTAPKSRTENASACSQSTLWTQSLPPCLPFLNRTSASSCSIPIVCLQLRFTLPAAPPSSPLLRSRATAQHFRPHRLRPRPRKTVGDCLNHRPSSPFDPYSSLDRHRTGLQGDAFHIRVLILDLVPHVRRVAKDPRV